MTKYEKMTIEEFARATDLLAHLVAGVDGFQKGGLKILDGIQSGRVTLDLVFDPETIRFGWEKHVNYAVTPIAVTNDGAWSSSIELKEEEIKPIGEVEINLDEAKPKRKSK
jgi:hypothetical protein